MPIYHCTTKTIGRAAGRSSVAAAAYRSGTRLVDERQERVHDYTHKAGVVQSGIELPDNAPERWLDRSTLWNEVERVERGARAQTAREIEGALPRELSRDEQVELVRDFASVLTAQGMVVDWSIHDPGGDGRNLHVHYLQPQRSCDETGFLAKSVTVYVCAKEGETELGRFSPAELAEHPGWEKLYRYNGKEMTMAQAEAAGLDPKKDRDRRQPVQETRYLNNWNEKERVQEWRQAWQDCQNAALERHYEREQVPEEDRTYVDCRSLKDQGVDRQATVHEGPAVRAMEQRAQEQAEREGRAYEPVTHVHQRNVEIQQDNGVLAEVRRQIADTVQRIRDAAQQLIERWRDGRDPDQQPAEPTPDQAIKAWEQAVQAERRADARLTDANRRDPDQGDVRCGEHLCWRDMVKADLDQAKAELAKVDTRLDQAKDRLQDLERHRIVNRSKIPDARAEVAKAQAEHDKAKAEVARLTASYQSAKLDYAKALVETKPAHDKWQAEVAKAKADIVQAKELTADRLVEVNKALDRMPPEQALKALEDRWISEVRACTSDDLCISSDVIERQAERAAAEIADPVQRYAALNAAAERLDRAGSHLAASRVSDMAETAKSLIPADQRQQADRTASAMVDRLDQRWGAALDRTPEPINNQPAPSLDLRTR